jgi:chemotaxis protein MotA
MLLIVGSLIVIGSVVGGYTAHGGSMLVLYQPSELVIIGGAALGQLVISTPMPVIKAMIGQFKGFFSSGNAKSDYLELLGLQYQLYKLVQQSGVMSL